MEVFEVFPEELLRKVYTWVVYVVMKMLVLKPIVLTRWRDLGFQRELVDVRTRSLAARIRAKRGLSQRLKELLRHTAESSHRS